jgi:lysophospholipase L1-like esterase
MSLTKLKGFAAVALVTLALIKLVDVGFALFLPEEYPFLPNSRARYTSSEFDAVASINGFGFRGNETQLEPGQIALFGDSFTFGFGSKDDDVWARLLQHKLAGKPRPLKVYNLGVPGTDSDFHLDLATRYVPKLKPKYVIVSVLLADDFQQAYEEALLKQQPKAILIVAKEWLRAAFPGLRQFYLRARTAPVVPSGPDATPMNATADWGANARKLIAQQNLKLPADVLAEALAGNVNPGILALLGPFADRSWKFWSAVDHDALAQAVLARLTARFAQLNALVQSHGGKLIVYSMTESPFVHSVAAQKYQRYGYTVREEDFTTLKPETVLSRLAQQSGALLVPSLTKFREHRGDELFFALDGHMTVAGNRLVADILADALAELAAAP